MLENRHSHVAEGVLLALLDGEIEAAERERVERRVAECAACAARLDALRFTTRRVTAALDVIGTRVEPTEMPEALRKAARSAPVPLAAARRRRLGWRGRRSVAVAAGLTFLLAAGAYAAPGSPVRGWVDGGIDVIASWLGDQEGPAEAEPSRVSVEPHDGSVRVTITGASETLRLRVRLTDEAEASVTASDANFHVEPGVIEVIGAADDVGVALPRGARSGSVVIDETEVVRLEDGALRRTAPAAEGAARISIDVDR